MRPSVGGGWHVPPPPGLALRLCLHLLAALGCVAGSMARAGLTATAHAAAAAAAAVPRCGTTSAAGDCCSAGCFAQALPNFQTGVSFLGYNPACFKGGLGCLGSLDGCRFCRLAGADSAQAHLPLCPACVCRRYRLPAARCDPSGGLPIPRQLPRPPPPRPPPPVRPKRPGTPVRRPPPPTQSPVNRQQALSPPPRPSPPPPINRAQPPPPRVVSPSPPPPSLYPPPPPKPSPPPPKPSPPPPKPSPPSRSPPPASPPPLQSPPPPSSSPPPPRSPPPPVLSPPPPVHSPPPPPQSPPPPPPPPPPPGAIDWGTPILTATFTSGSLNRSLFDVEQDCWGGGNGELQCYVDRPENLRVENGRLVIEARRGDWTGSLQGCTRPEDTYACTASKPFTSARLRTKLSPDGSWLYGRVEVRAQMPSGAFLWPAIWMLPTDSFYGTWAASGEIDIAEFRGQPSLNDTLEGTVHYGAAWPANAWRGSGPTRFPGADFSAGMHDFALEWTSDPATGRPKLLRWLVDGAEFYRLALDVSWSVGAASPYTQAGQPWDKRFHLLLNLAVGGGFFPASQYGAFGDHATWDATSAGWSRPRFEIEHVKVWAWPPAGS